ncbi:MAG: alpha-amylase, partial [bacterium]
MSSICLTLLVTAPCRLKHYSFFDIGESASYEDDVLTFELLERAATKRILPANDILRKRLKDYGGDFRVAIALSGKALDLYERFKPEVLDSFKSLAETGFVEFISAPHHNSLASLFSPQEFQEQAIMHRDRIHALFG